MEQATVKIAYKPLEDRDASAVQHLVRTAIINHAFDFDKAGQEFRKSMDIMFGPCEYIQSPDQPAICVRTTMPFRGEHREFCICF
jgi:hypothetical protein